MTATPFDSPTWRGLFHDPDLAPLFTETAALRADLLVIGTLAITQAKADIVPEVSAQAIHRAAMEVQIDPAALSVHVAATADPVAALVERFQTELQAPEHAKWIHHASDTTLTGATGLSLRLRQSLRILAERLGSTETPPVFAFHTDADMRRGLADGLNLTDGGETDPDSAVHDIAAWIQTQAQSRTPKTQTGQALQHHIAHLYASLQSAAPSQRHIIVPMTLPQLVLGLGTLLRHD